MNTNQTAAGAVHVTAADFEDQVVRASGPVLADFWAPWCGPCRQLAPLLEQLAGEYAGRLKVAKIDIDESPQLAAQFGITSIPTLLVFKNGQVVEQLVGLVSKKTLASKVDAHLT